jgi:hypothetical protein
MVAAVLVSFLSVMVRSGLELELLAGAVFLLGWLVLLSSAMSQALLRLFRRMRG